VAIFDLKPSGGEKQMSHLNTFEILGKLTRVSCLNRSRLMVVGNAAGYVYLIDITTAEIVYVEKVLEKAICTI
jgi:hypothetical protein